MIGAAAWVDGLGHERCHLSAVLSRLPARSDDSSRGIGGRRLTAKIARQRTAFAGHALDGAHETGRSVGLAEVLQHQHGRPERAQRIGNAAAHDVECRAVNGLEHGRECALRIDVARGRDAEAAGKRRCEIRENVGVQVGGHHRINAGRVVDESAPPWHRPACGRSAHRRRRPSHPRTPRPTAPWRAAVRWTWSRT